MLSSLKQTRTCTLREAIIVGSLISKTSIPVLHSSAAMLKIAEMDYSGDVCFLVAGISLMLHDSL